MKYIALLGVAGLLLFPSVSNAQTTDVEEIRQQLIQLLLQKVEMLQAQIAEIKAEQAEEPELTWEEKKQKAIEEANEAERLAESEIEEFNTYDDTFALDLWVQENIETANNWYEVHNYDDVKPLLHVYRTKYPRFYPGILTELEHSPTSQDIDRFVDYWEGWKRNLMSDEEAEAYNERLKDKIEEMNDDSLSDEEIKEALKRHLDAQR